LKQNFGILGYPVATTKKAGYVLKQTLYFSILVFIAGASYGLIVPVIKGAEDLGIYPNTFVPLQYLIALVVCLIVMLIRRVKWARPKSLAALALLGVFTGGTSVCYYNAVSLLPTSAALTLLFQYIWISVLIESVHKKKLPTKSTVVAIIVVLIGTVFATGLMDGSVNSLDPVGVLFGLGSAVFYALFLYYSGMVETNQPVILRATMLAAGGLIFTSLTCPGAYVEALPNPETWPYAISLAILGILFPTTLINYASPHLTTGMVSIMASSELPVGILAAWALVADVPSPLVLFGACLVFVGIIVKQAPAVLAKR
jgi:drug/metabolite transporter (DMT)-like permease